MSSVRKSWVLMTAAMVVAAGSLCPPRAAAQVTTAEIDGRIVDQKGSPIEDIEVVARNQETGNYQVTHSEDNGRYHFHLLTPGRYQLTAQHVNYNRAVKDNISLVVGQTSVINFRLVEREIQVGETVVEAEAPVIDTKKSDLEVVVQPEQIQSLPLNSRNFLELAEVAPGAKVSTGGRGPVTTGALNSRFVTAYIDGVDFKNDDLGGVVGTSFGFTTNIVPEDAIREFQVITSMYKAEYAKASNGMINAVTQVGGNELHGSAFSLFRASGLNAQGPFETIVNPLTGKSKPDYNRQQYGFSLGGPIVKDQTHFFVSLERNTINNFNTVYTSGIQPSLEGTFKNPTTENLALAKISHQFSTGNFFDLRLLDVSTDNTPGNFGGTLTYGNGFNLSFRLLSLLATDRWLIGPNTENELRVHYQRYTKDATPNSTDPEHVFVSSGIVTGWNENQPQTEEQEKYQIRDDLEYNIPELVGAHVLKGGITLTRERFLSAAAFFSGASFSFRSDTSRLPFSGTIGVGDPTTQQWNTAFGVYLQDDWTPVSNLTLNLGLRWDVESNMIDNNYVNPFGADTALTNHVSSDYIGRGDRSVDYGQIAPRLGFAWDLFDDKTMVLHGGWGVFYDRMIWNFPSNELNNGIYNVYNIAFNASTPATLSRDTLSSYVARRAGSAAAPGLVLFPSSLPTAHTQQWTMGVTRQLSPAMAVSLNYVNIRGFDEYTTINVNYRKGTTGPRVLTPAFGAINLVTAAGRSWYDGIELGLTRIYQGDWQMQLSYTLSWAFDTFDDPFAGYVFPSSIQRAPSAQDERHRLVLSGVVNLPAGFQVSGIAALGSPRPIPVTLGTDLNQDGVFTDDFPASGRNSERPDAGLIRNWSKNVDLRATKYFTLSGDLRLALIVDAFNVFNWTNYLTYVSTLNARGIGGVSRFAVPTSASNPRQIQLGARVLF